jgi:hypothetical protein
VWALNEFDFTNMSGLLGCRRVVCTAATNTDHKSEQQLAEQFILHDVTNANTIIRATTQTIRTYEI